MNSTAIETIEMDNKEEYYILKRISHNKEFYVLLSNINNVKDILVKKEIILNGTIEYVPIQDKNLFKDVLTKLS